MEEVFTFDQLPKAVAMLVKEISEIKRLLIEKRESPAIDQREQLLTIKEAAELLGLTVPTIYSKVSKNELPVMKRDKRLYFSRVELLEYIKAGRKKTIAEIEEEAKAYLLNNKKGGLNNGK